MALTWQDLAADIRRDPDAFIDERDRRRLSWFARRMFPGYQPAAHIDRLIEALEWATRTPGARLIVTMPPRSSKSLHVSELFPAWYLGNHPDNRLIAASHSSHLAYTFSRRVRNLIADPRYPFPNVAVAGDKGAVQAWDIEGTRGGYIAVGVGGSPTGQGGQVILIDDPLRSAADAESQTVRDNIGEWFSGTIRTRLEPGGSIILTATRWNDDDLTGRLLAAQLTGGEQWRHLHFPAISDAGEALWPERWPLDELHRIKAAVGSRSWNALYQGDPVASEGGTFKPHWWRTYDRLPEDISRVEVTVDSAFKTGVGNDYSVCACWAADARGNVYLVHVWRERVEFPELISMGVTAWQWASARFPGIAVSLVPEDKASGQSAIQVWRRENRIPVVPYAVPSGESKISRAEAVTPYVEGGRVFIPEYAPWLAEWRAEHDRFPFGTHDDQVDTTTIALSRFLLHGSGEFRDLPDVTVAVLEAWADE